MSLYGLLFPDYNETMRRQKQQREAGLQYIAAYGLNIGDTVYLGRFAGVVEDAYVGFGTWDLMPETPFIIIGLFGEDAAEYVGIERYRSLLKVDFLCQMGDFTKDEVNV